MDKVAIRRRSGDDPSHAAQLPRQDRARRQQRERSVAREYRGKRGCRARASARPRPYSQGEGAQGTKNTQDTHYLHLAEFRTNINSRIRTKF